MFLKLWLKKSICRLMKKNKFAANYSFLLSIEIFMKIFKFINVPVYYILVFFFFFTLSGFIFWITTYFMLVKCWYINWWLVVNEYQQKLKFGTYFTSFWMSFLFPVISPQTTIKNNIILYDFKSLSLLLKCCATHSSICYFLLSLKSQSFPIFMNLW